MTLSEVVIKVNSLKCSLDTVMSQARRFAKYTRKMRVDFVVSCYLESELIMIKIELSPKLSLLPKYPFHFKFEISGICDHGTAGRVKSLYTIYSFWIFLGNTICYGIGAATRGTVSTVRSKDLLSKNVKSSLFSFKHSHT
jgi:hypothetical protein